MANKRNICNELGIKIESPYWEDAYRKAIKDPVIPAWLTEMYIRKLHDDFNLLPTHLDDVLKAAEQVRRYDSLCLLAKTLYHLLALKKPAEDVFLTIELPQADAENDDALGFNYVSLFPLMAHVPGAYCSMISRGIDPEVVKKLLPDLMKASQPQLKKKENRLLINCILLG